MTQQQVAEYAAGHPSLMVSVPDLMGGRPVIDELLAFAEQHRDAGPMLYSSADAGDVAALQQRFGRQSVAERVEALFGDLAVALHGAGFTRIVVAGGETSGAVVTALGLKSFALGPEIDPGVPALVAASTKPLAMALKSGNFGTSTFFAKALQALNVPHRN
jgi:uncharacterized protein YgbK (DUF1537 family)